MTLLSDLLTTVTESQYWTRLTAAYDAVSPSVPWRFWSVRNPYLALSRFCTLGFAELRALVTYLASGMYLDTGEGAALELFVKSQFSLTPDGAVSAKGRILLRGVGGAPAYTFAAGSITIGTPGPFTDRSRLYTNTEPGAIDPNGVLMLEFEANEAGDAYNLPVYSELELKTSYAGIVVSNPPSGPATAIGSGNSGLLFNAGAVGVTVDLLNLGASQVLAVNGFISGAVEITLETNAGSVVVSTAEDVRRAVRDAISGGLTLLFDCRNAGDGSGLVAMTPTPVALEFTGTWLSQAGAPAQTADILRTLAASRWDTRGGGAGDGAPPSDAATADALVYWGLQKPAGYAQTPVRHIRIYSNLDPDTGLASGGVTTVMLAGPAGALSATDVAAVEALYYNPRKFCWSSRLAVRSAANLVIAVTAVVYVKRASLHSLAQVQGLVEAALTDFQVGTATEPGFDIGETVYPQTLGARMADADKIGIRNVDLTVPATPVSATYAQIPVLDLSGVSYVFV